MLYDSFCVVKDNLNTYLRQKYQLDEDIVVISNLVDLDGSIAINASNKIVISLVNLEKESTLIKGKSYKQQTNELFSVQNPPLFLNIYFVISANFSNTNYEEALKFLSSVLMYFQKTPVFNHNNMSNFPETIEKLIFEIVDMDFQELSHLWGIVTGKYIPSIVYKMRMVTVDSGDIVSEAFISANTDTSANKNN